MVRISNRSEIKWVERTSGLVQTLISNPAPNLLVKISAAGAEPKLVNSTPKRIKRVAVQKLFLTPLPIPRPSVILLKQVTVPVSPQPVAAVPGQISVTPKQAVPLPKQAFAWPPEEQPLVEISNGTGRSRMAARTHDFLSGNGVAVRWLTNADHYGHRETTIYYTPGWQNHARRLARLFPAEVDFQLIDSHRSDLRVELGADLNEFDRTVLMDQGRTSYVSSK